MRKVEVIPHHPTWQERFETESKQVKDALGENVVAIHHIGSTAIPGIYAKPILDLLVEVKHIAKVDEQNVPMALLGYEVMGELASLGVGSSVKITKKGFGPIISTLLPDRSFSNWNKLNYRSINIWPILKNQVFGSGG